LGYAAAAGDLAYPEKLEMMESIAESLQQQHQQHQRHQRKASTSSIASAASVEVAAITSQRPGSHASSKEIIKLL